MEKQKIQKLRELRELRSYTNKEMSDFLEALPLTERIREIRLNIEELEQDIRDEAIVMYNKTGEKKFGQIGIRMMTKYDYDEFKALDWAKEHNLCLALDKSAFKKQLKVSPLEFVDVSEIPTATIPTEIKIE